MTSEREHAKRAVEAFMDEIRRPEQPLSWFWPEIADLVERERAAAVREALEEAARVCDEGQAYAAKKAAQHDYEAKDCWRARELEASELGMAIRALMPGEKP